MSFYYVAIKHPYMSTKYVLEVKKRVDELSPDLVGVIDDNIRTPLEGIIAKNVKEAKEIYYQRHPKVKKVIETTHINVKTS